MAPLLEARGLTKRFGGVTALDDLDLEIEPGDVIGVMGPNGAGKSTLLKTLLGEIRPDSGDVLLDGRSVLGWPTHRIARLGVALANQIPRPFLRLTVAQNVRVGALAGGSRMRDVDVLALCGLDGKAHRPAGSLGLLDLKRLEMARALSLHPRVLFLDEVGAGLVAHETEQMIDIVRKVHAEGVALVVVEHVEAVIRGLAQQVVVIDWGKVVARGTPEEVAADPTVRSIYLGEGGALERTRAEQPRSLAEAPLLELDGVTARYGRAVALDGVTLRVQPGEVVSVLGANGAGKTTMTRVITGLLPAAAGEVRMAGTVLNDLPPHRRLGHGIACCPEGRRIFGELTVHENLLMGAFLSRADTELERVYALFPVLRQRRSQLAQTLSGGEQQMVALGRALMAKPRLMLLDEPSLGLAPKLVAEMFRLIREINAAGVTILLVEQNARQALRISHRAYVLEKGRVTASGIASSLASDPAVVASYLGT